MIVPTWQRITAGLLAFLLAIALGVGVAYLLEGMMP